MAWRTHIAVRSRKNASGETIYVRRKLGWTERDDSPLRFFVPFAVVALPPICFIQGRWLAGIAIVSGYVALATICWLVVSREGTPIWVQIDDAKASSVLDSLNAQPGPRVSLVGRPGPPIAFVSSGRRGKLMRRLDRALAANGMETSDRPS